MDRAMDHMSNHTDQAIEETVANPTADRADTWTNRRASEQAVRAMKAAKVSGRRRRIDPATCERDYTDNELEFMMAMHEYKRSSGRMFPTWSEALEVLESLGYQKVSKTNLDYPPVRALVGS
jgi:hypothetical protein